MGCESVNQKRTAKRCLLITGDAHISGSFPKLWHASLGDATGSRLWCHRKQVVAVFVLDLLSLHTWHFKNNHIFENNRIFGNNRMDLVNILLHTYM